MQPGQTKVALATVEDGVIDRVETGLRAVSSPALWTRGDRAMLAFRARDGDVNVVAVADVSRFF